MLKNVETTGHENVYMQKQNVGKQKIINKKKDMKILVVGFILCEHRVGFFLQNDNFFVWP